MHANELAARIARLAAARTEPGRQSLAGDPSPSSDRRLSPSCTTGPLGSSRQSYRPGQVAGVDDPSRGARVDKDPHGRRVGLRSYAAAHPGCRILVARTAADVRDVVIEGGERHPAHLARERAPAWSPAGVG